MAMLVEPDACHLTACRSRSPSAAEALADHQMKRAAEQQRDRMPDESGSQTAARRLRQILADRQRRNVAVSAPVEIAR